MRSQQPHATRRTAQEWQQLVNECLEGGHKKPAFCKERGLGYAAFMSHCARITKKAVKTDETAPDRLIAMKLVTMADSTLSGPNNSALCSLILNNGVTLHIHDRHCFADIVSRLIPNASII